MDKPRIAIVGAGAIGGITAAFMADAGYDVYLVCKHKEIADISKNRGLHITGAKGEHSIKVNAVAKITELSGVFDICLIATKAYDMPRAAEDMLPLLNEDSLVVAMQNGICTDALSEVVGENRTVGCVIGFGATMHNYGELEMTSTGEFIIGTVNGKKDDRLEMLKKALSTVAKTEISESIMSELYSKLIVNSCITSTGAICGLRLGEMMKIRQARKIFLAIIREAMNVARAMNLTVYPYGGKLDYVKLLKGDSVIDNFRRHAIIRIVGIKYKNLKSSSLQSLERNRPTEIDYFNGYIFKKGEDLGVKTPINKHLVNMVKEIEQGKRHIVVKNLFDSVFAEL